LSLDLLLDQLAPVLADFFDNSLLSKVDLGCVSLRNALQLLALFVLFAEYVDQLVGVDVLVDFKLLDLLLELLESFCLLVFVLVEALPVSLNLLHLVLELLNDLLGGGERLLSEQELLLEDRLTLLRLCHLVPEIRIVGQLLLH